MERWRGGLVGSSFFPGGGAGRALLGARCVVFDSPPGEGEGLPVYSCLKSTGEAVTSGDRNLGPPHMV